MQHKIEFMVKSLLRYAKFFSYSLFKSEVRKIVFGDVKRFYFGTYIRNNTTINPWSENIYHEQQREAGLEAAVNWLLQAQKAMTDSGMGSYHLIHGWTSSYVETTGYIVPSLLDYGRETNNQTIIDAALSAADWLISVQKPSGGWQGACIADNKDEVVFNTGQVIRGMRAAYLHTKQEKYLEAARKACDWLLSIQEAQGYWQKFAFMGVPRVYDSYVDAPLLEIYELTGEERYKEAALKNLNWIIAEKQLENGWFEDCDNTIKRNDKPILHTIAYTIDGLLDSGIILQDKTLIDAATKAADKLLGIFSKNKWLHGRFDRKWKGSEYMLNTGCAQISIIWLKLYKLTTNPQYLNAALKMNDILLFVQDRKGNDSLNTKGALPGSFPVWGRYEAFAFPNWATKYFVDALLLEQQELQAKTAGNENRD